MSFIDNDLRVQHYMDITRHGLQKTLDGEAVALSQLVDSCEV